MTSSYSADLKLELMVTGENAGTWGDNTNNNLNLIQQAIAGYEQVTLSSGGTLALAMTDKTISNARNMVIKFATASIAASTICTIPNSIEKFYIFDCTGLTNPSNLTIKTASGTGFTPDAAKIYAAYADGTNLKEISLDTLGGTIAAAQIATDAVTTAKILQSNVTQAKMATNSVGTVQLKQSNVTLTKMAANSVGPSQLQSTAVTAGSYTTANITVDEDGRINSAATGSAGATIFGIRQWSISPASGQYATPSATTNLFVWMQSAAGGGGGTHNGGTPTTGGNGGAGKFGAFTIPVSASSQVAYAVGTGGTGGNGTPSTMSGNAGNASGTIAVGGQTYINAANGGNGATYHNANGNAGAASTFAITQQVDISANINPLSQIYQNYSLPNLGGTAQIPSDDDGYWFGLTGPSKLGATDLPFHGQGGGNYPAPYGGNPNTGPGLPGGTANMIIFDKL